MYSNYVCPNCTHFKTDEYVRPCYRVSSSRSKSRKISITDILAFLFIIMAATTTVNGAYLNKLPVQYQTKYSTLLRKRRAELAANSMIPACMTAEEMKNCRVNCTANLCPVTESVSPKEGLSDKVPSKLKSLFQLLTGGNVERKSFQEKNLRLSALEKCRKEGLENSILCQLDYIDPDASSRIFNQILPKLMIQAEIARVSPASNEHESDTTNDYGSNAAADNGQEQERLTERIFKRSSPKFMSRKKRQAAESFQEMCQTEWSTTPPPFATHVSSNTDVELYVHRDQNMTVNNLVFTQKFEVGRCKRNHPVLSVNIVGDPQTPGCRVSRSKHFATFVIDPEEHNIDMYKNCVVFMVKSREFAICRDWIYLNSSCRMYFQTQSIAK